MRRRLGRSWLRALPLVLLWLAGALAYANSLHNALVLDDTGNLVRNPGIRRIWPPSAALCPPKGPIGFWTRPVTNLTFAWDYARSQTDVAGYRQTNLLLHVLAATGLYGLLKRVFRGRESLGGPGPWTDPDRLPGWAAAGFGDGAGLAAFTGALLWTVHPLNTAAVDYLSQRGELLVALFAFWMFRMLARTADAAPGRFRAAWGALGTAGFCLLGMGSKETMLAVPLLALLFDRIFLAESWRDVARRRGVLHAALWLTALWPLHRQWVYSPHVDSSLAAGLHGPYLLTQCRGVAHLIRLAFWPHPLVFFYGRDLVRNPLEVWPQALLLAGLGAGGLWALVRRPRLGFAAAWFFGLLAPSSTVVPILGQPIAEHRMYAPLAALTALAAGGGWVLASRRLGRRAAPAYLGIALLLAAGGGAATWRRNADYRTPRTLWADTVRKRPDIPEARHDLGNALRQDGQTLEALAQYREALRLRPEYVDAHFNLGTLLSQLGRSDEALAHFVEALRLRPDSPQIEETLGMAHARAGRPGEALAWLEKASGKLGDPSRILAERARMLSDLERGEEALGLLRETLASRPNDPLLVNVLGGVLCRMGRPAEAVEVLQAAVAADPSNDRIRRNLAQARRAAAAAESPGNSPGNSQESTKPKKGS